jgi:hypothetical protein
VDSTLLVGREILVGCKRGLPCDRIRSDHSDLDKFASAIHQNDNLDHRVANVTSVVDSGKL